MAAYGFKGPKRPAGLNLPAQALTRRIYESDVSRILYLSLVEKELDAPPKAPEPLLARVFLREMERLDHLPDDQAVDG